MKTTYHTILVAVIAIIGCMNFAACDKDKNDEDRESTVDVYSFLLPCLYWDGSMEDIKSLLNSSLPQGYTIGEIDTQWLVVSNNKDAYPITRYHFENGKLESVYVHYRRINDDTEYERICAELDKRYGKLGEEYKHLEGLDYDNFWMTNDKIHVAYLKKNVDNEGNKVWGIVFCKLVNEK